MTLSLFSRNAVYSTEFHNTLFLPDFMKNGLAADPRLLTLYGHGLYISHSS